MCAATYHEHAATPYFIEFGFPALRRRRCNFATACQQHAAEPHFPFFKLQLVRPERRHERAEPCHEHAVHGENRTGLEAATMGLVPDTFGRAGRHGPGRPCCTRHGAPYKAAGRIMRAGGCAPCNVKNMDATGSVSILQQKVEHIQTITGLVRFGGLKGLHLVHPM